MAEQSKTLKIIMENIFNLLNKSGMQAKDFAIMLGKRPNLVTDWRAGRATPALDTIVDICNIFDCDITDIYPEYLIKRKNAPSDKTELLSYFDMLSDEAKNDLIMYAKFRYSQEDK